MFLLGARILPEWGTQLDLDGVVGRMGGMDGEFRMKQRLRIFFALWPDDGERGALAAWQTPLHELCGGRAMRPDTLHTTLVFLGDVPADRLEALQRAAQETAFEPFSLCFDGARYWSHNHVVFAAPSVAPAPLHALVRSLEQRLAAHRFRFERRPYKPHITLLRHAQWGAAALPALPPVVWQVRDFVLVSSLRDERGARYEVFARYPGK